MSARRLVLLLCLALALGVVSTAGGTPPGPNGRIVFALDAGQGGELYSVNPDGSGLARLTWTAQAEQNPAWSADGTRIAYESSLGGRFRVWAMNADGSGQTQLTFSSDSVDDSDPTWSPDGTQIAFASTRSGTWNLWVMNADGSSVRRLSDVFATSPAWSPDGRRLAYVGLGGIGVVGVDGSDPHIVTAPGGFASGPSWSPDGTRIVFTRNNPAGYPGELYVAKADGSGESQLTSDGTLHARPSWSPDATQIVFQGSPAPSAGWSLWTIGVDGTGLRQLPYSGGNELAPDWGTSLNAPQPPDAPAIQIYSPDPATLYFPGMRVPAFYTCSSAVSYIVACSGDVPSGALLDLTQAGAHVFTVRALDAVGHTATASVTYQVIDIVPPQIDIRSPADGATYELGALVPVDYSCSDPNGTGVAACLGDIRIGALLDTSRTGTFTFNVVAVDNSHNPSHATATYTIVDRTPTVQITSPADGSTYTLGDVVTASYSCASPAGARIVGCAGPVPTGSPIDTGTIGTKTFAVTATDDQGLTTRKTATYSVLYAFTGFDSPVSSSGSIDAAKAGESLPLKFSLHGNQGLGVVTQVTAQPASCTDRGALAGSSPAQGKLTYYASSDRYIDLVATDPTWKGTCRIVDLALADGTHHAIFVAFTK